MSSALLRTNLCRSFSEEKPKKNKAVGICFFSISRGHCALNKILRANVQCVLHECCSGNLNRSTLALVWSVAFLRSSSVCYGRNWCSQCEMDEKWQCGDSLECKPMIWRDVFVFRFWSPSRAFDDENSLLCVCCSGCSLEQFGGKGKSIASSPE